MDSSFLCTHIVCHLFVGEDAFPKEEPIGKVVLGFYILACVKETFGVNCTKRHLNISNSFGGDAELARGAGTTL